MRAYPVSIPRASTRGSDQKRSVQPADQFAIYGLSRRFASTVFRYPLVGCVFGWALSLAETAARLGVMTAGGAS